jgi:hypothetical protein
MKTLTGLLMLASAGLVTYGQQATRVTPPTPPTPVAAARVLSEISASTDKIVKGSPFSGEAVSESVQTLGDGNRIVRNWSEKLYRSGDGKFRRESSGGSGAAFGSIVTSNGITILNPTGGARYTLNPDNMTGRAYTLRATLAPVIINGQSSEKGPIILNGSGQGGGTFVTTTVDMDKLKTELNAVQAAEVRAVTAAKLATTVTLAAPAAMGGSTNGQKWETRTEQLGMQNFEGVDAEGTRTVTTIPADAIGNERPIEIVYERWYSKELQLIVYSKHSDPRFGEQTYRLTNINRSEPDPSIFEVPSGYRILNENTLFRTTSPRTTSERVTTTRSATASRP